MRKRKRMGGEEEAAVAGAAATTTAAAAAAAATTDSPLHFMTDRERHTLSKLMEGEAREKKRRRTEEQGARAVSGVLESAFALREPRLVRSSAPAQLPAIVSVPLKAVKPWKRKGEGRVGDGTNARMMSRLSFKQARVARC